jgi:hypothetical protein
MASPDRHFANAAIFTHSTGLTPNTGDAALYIKSDNKAYIKDSAGNESGLASGYLVENDFIDPYNYIGVAEIGTLTSSPTWNITRIEILSDGSTISLYATGAWTNRTSLVYA